LAVENVETPVFCAGSVIFYFFFNIARAPPAKLGGMSNPETTSSGRDPLVAAIRRLLRATDRCVRAADEVRRARVTLARVLGEPPRQGEDGRDG